MKKLILFNLLLASIFVVKAQQDAQYTQFFMNKLSFNAGYAGSEDKICATVLYRNQWLGFGNTTSGGSPVTLVANIHSPLGDKFGIGLNIKADQLGFEQSVNPILSFSYRFKFKDEGVLAAGVGIGMMQKTLAGDKLNPLQDGDSKIPNTSVSGRAADVEFGLYYTRPTLWRFDNFYSGLSATHLTQGNVQYSWGANGTVDNPMQMHTYFITGASYQLNGAIAIEPNILAKTDFAKTSADINAMVMYNNKIRAGLTYRTSDAVSVLLGYKFTPNLQVGYSYDLTTSNIINYSSGSHEIVMRYCFMPKTKTKPDKQPIPRLTPRFL